MIIQILSLDMRKALKIALIPPGPDFCTQLHHAHIAVVSYEKFFKILDPIRIRSTNFSPKNLWTDPDRNRIASGSDPKFEKHIYPHLSH